MWDLGNRGVVALASAFTGCVFIYNVWGPILILTISLLFTIYACYSLIVNDSLLSPHAFLLFDYCKNVSVKVRASIEGIVDHVYQYTGQLLEATNRRFRKRYLTPSRMERRRGSHYQLSSDSYPSSRESSNSKGRFHPRLSHATLYDHSPFGKHTSTPIYPRKKEEFENRTLHLSTSDRTLPREASSPRRSSYASPRQQDATYFSTESTPWSVRASSKAATAGAERKSSDTFSGPLLSSTRYNIDPKVYNDATSPGLTARLSKYAAEASNALTRQAQYRVGQFPKVNLHATPVPLINAKSVKTRTPVTVRVAPPDAVRYSPPSKQKILADLHRPGIESCSPGVAQALREISLKRHASREDVSFDLAKKQRTDGLADKESQDETKQKRSREESLKSDEDNSPQSKTVRPTKRTKTPSCYDIINSLSSSKHVVSGVKRKARDISRSGTPDFEKHFKSLECVQGVGTQTLPRIRNTSPKPHGNYDDISAKRTSPNACGYAENLRERSPLKGILKNNGKIFEAESEDQSLEEKEPSVRSNGKDRSGSTGSTESMRLTQKLFMRAEPERNEKLRMLVEEQGNIRAKFTTDDVDEIKKEDIADMRQTSMKARLQSMFDAISGKAASRINPDVVIQAEEVSNAIESVACPVTCATLNSSTITTNVNTTPISTSAVVPSPGTSESNAKSPKHVAFALPGKEASSVTNVQQFVDSYRTKTENVSTVANTTTIATSGILSRPTVSASTNTSVPDFDSGKSASTTSIVSGSSTRDTFTLDADSAGKEPFPVLTASTNAASFGNVTTATSTASTVSMDTKTNVAKDRNEENQSNSKSNASQASSTASFGSNMATGKGTVIFAASNTNTNTVTSNTPVVPESRNSSATLFGVVATSVSSTGPSSSTNTGIGSAPLFTFGSETARAAASTKSDGIFAFGSSAGNTSQSGATFGSLATSRPASSVDNAAKSTNDAAKIVTTVGFGQSSKSNAPNFGTSTRSTFASHGTTTSSATDGKIGFSFGTTSIATNVSTGSSSTAVFTVGKTSIAATGFGASTSTVSGTSRFASNTGSMFTNSTPAQSIFGTTTTGNQAIFGASSGSSSGIGPTFTLPKSTAPSIFGSNVAATTTGFATRTSIPLFSNTGNDTASGTTCTASMTVFGSNASTPASVTSGTSGTGSTSNAATSGNVFSCPNSTATSSSTFPTTTNGIFGQGGKSPSAGASLGNGLGAFGNNSGLTLFPLQTNASSTFGATKLSSNPTSTTFGTSSSIPVSIPASIPASNGTASSFGAANSTTAGFVSQPKTESGGQSAGTQAFAIGSSIFGTENTGTTAFGRGASSAAAGPFDASASSNSFTGQTTNPTFGTANAPTGVFGDANKASPFGTQTSAFGTPNVPTSATNNNSTGVFTFGASQKPAQQTSTFSFGSNNNTSSTSSSSVPFQFGAATSSSSGTGFNFSAPSTTPSINFGTTSAAPTFNASTPGMFSIGSGSTAPRSRNMRTRKPR